MLMLPAAVILTGAAKVTVPFINASALNEPTASAVLMLLAALPAVVPTAIVAAPPDVAAVVEFNVAPTITALSGKVAVVASVIAPIAPPSTAKSYLALAVRNAPSPKAEEAANFASVTFKSRILAVIEEERKKKISAERNSQIGSGDRSEKIRTYNFPQDRLTDHRIKKTWFGLDQILDGNIKKIIEELKKVDQQNSN